VTTERASDTIVTRSNPAKDVYHLLAVVVAVVTIAALYFARVVLIPFALAVLFTFILTPVVRLLERAHLGRAFSSLLVVLLTLGTCASLGWGVSKQFGQVVNELPSYKLNIKEKLASLHWSESHVLHNASETVTEISKDLAAKPAPSSSDSAQTLEATPSANNRPATARQPVPVQVISPPSLPLESMQSVLGLLARALIVVVFTIFMLIQREDLRNRLISLIGHGHIHLITQTLDEASSRVSKYLLMQFLVNIGYGIFIGMGLYFIGLPGALLWGVIVGILRFLPYIGPPLGGIMPLLLSMAVFDGWSKPLLVLGLFVITELAVSNLVEPVLYGAHTGISSLAILMAAIFWTAIWGPIGLVVSTPLTVCLLVVGRHVPQLRFLHILLGDEPPLTPESRFYQRLLAMDYEEAREVLQKCLNEMSLEELYENVMIPALGLAEQDRHQNLLQDENEKFISQSTRELIDELWDPRNGEGEHESEGDGSLEISPKAAAPHPVRPLSILCVPARDEADEIVGTMLAQLLQGAGHRAECLEVESAERIIAQISREKPDIVCISALPPFAIPAVRALYGRMHAQNPNQKILVGLWHFSGDSTKLGRRLALKEDSRAFTTLAELVHEVQEMSSIPAQPVEHS
jgi:predicted PurR-regulated permease PerM